MTTCMGCALKDTEISELRSALSQQRSGTLNLLITLKVMMQEEEWDNVMDLLEEYTGDES